MNTSASPVFMDPRVKREGDGALDVERL